MPRKQLQQNYTRDQVLRVANISERQLRSWEKNGLMQVSEEYTLADVKSLQTLLKMREAKLGPKRITHIFDEIRKNLEGVENPLTDVTVVLDKRNVHILIDGQRMEALSGQLLFNFDQQELSRILAFPKDRKSDKDVQREKAREHEAVEWFQRGVEMEEAGRSVEEATAAYQRALQLDPNCIGAIVNLGTIHFHARQWKQAEELYRKALQIEPEYALAHFNLGNLFDERGDSANALLHYNAALRIAPNYADAHYNVALLFQRAGQTMKAVRHWQAYLKVDPTSSWAEVARRELAKLRNSAVIKGSAARQ